MDYKENQLFLFLLKSVMGYFLFKSKFIKLSFIYFLLYS